MLAWFVAVLMAGVAAPAFATANGAGMAICSGGMVMMVADPQDDAASAASQALHCPACLAMIAPPPAELRLDAPPSAHRVSPPATGPPSGGSPQLPWNARAPPSKV